jgi:hypothetical protein
MNGSLHNVVFTARVTTPSSTVQAFLDACRQRNVILPDLMEFDEHPQGTSRSLSYIVRRVSANSSNGAKSAAGWLVGLQGNGRKKHGRTR